MEHGNSNGFLTRGTLAAVIGTLVLGWAGWVTFVVLEINADRAQVLASWSEWRGGVNVRLDHIDKSLAEIKDVHAKHGLSSKTGSDEPAKRPVELTAEQTP